MWALSAGVPLYAQVVFTDVTSDAGVDYVQFDPDNTLSCLLNLLPNGSRLCEAERMTGGAAAGDYDGDDHIDLYVTRLDDSDILYRNRGDGTFEDATAAAGLEQFNLQSNGAGFADIDNDGDLDLYVTTIGETRYYLFINDGAGHFTEQAIERGAAVESTNLHVGFSVSFGDYDRDGFLDVHLSEWRPASTVQPGARSHARMLRNKGAEAPGFFEDVTDAIGVALENVDLRGVWSFASAFVDLDADGWPDLAVTSDFGTSRLFWNNGDGTFSDGTTHALIGTDENGMGSTIADYDGDGRLDWFVTSIFDPDRSCEPNHCLSQGHYDGNRLFRNQGDRIFSDRTGEAGVRNGGWGWGAAFLDYDNDGDLDLAMTNGVDLGRGPFADQGPYIDSTMRFWRNNGGVMDEVSTEVLVTDTGNGKGLLTFDYDNDGDMDLFVVNNQGSPVLYRNDGGNDLDWLRVDVLGSRSNRDGLGTVVTVTKAPGGPSMVRVIGSTSHFLGQSEPTAHFGLGSGTEPVAEVRIDWPSGTSQVLRDVARNTRILVLEPATGPTINPAPPPPPHSSTDNLIVSQSDDDAEPDPGQAPAAQIPEGADSTSIAPSPVPGFLCPGTAVAFLAIPLGMLASHRRRCRAPRSD